MKQIDEYIDSLYKKQGNSCEIQEMKAEMKAHLLDAMKDLKQEGNSEEDSIRIAIERFGSERYLRGELGKLLQHQRKFAKKILGAALSFLVIAVAMISGVQAFLHYQAHDNASMQTAIYKVLGSSDTITTQQQNQITSIIKEYNFGNNYVAIFHTPTLNDGWIHSLNEASLVYPQSPTVNKYFPETMVGTSEHPSHWMIQIQPKSGFVGNNIIWGLVPFILLVAYWVLFAVWAIIDAYRRKQLTMTWGVAFLVLNVLAWLLFRSGSKARAEV